MGTWGTSLYAGDFAADLRGTIRAVVRLPFDADRLAETIILAERGAADNPDDEDHTTFWLVLADRLAHYGLNHDRVKETALRIIDSDHDLEMQRRLGQTAAGIEKRRRMLVELRDRIINPPSPAPRNVMRAPQSFVMNVGDAFAYPTCGGNCWNPYVTRPDQLMIYGPRGGEAWAQDGWGAMVIVERGLTFGFFAWYRALVSRSGYHVAPDVATLANAEWNLELPGTCTPLHFRRIRFVKVGEFPISVDRLHEARPGLRPGDSQAIRDITIANRLKVWSAESRRLVRQAGAQHRALRIRDLTE